MCQDRSAVSYEKAAAVLPFRVGREVLPLQHLRTKGAGLRIRIKGRDQELADGSPLRGLCLQEFECHCWPSSKSHQNYMSARSASWISPTDLKPGICSVWKWT